MIKRFYSKFIDSVVVKKIYNFLKKYFKKIRDNLLIISFGWCIKLLIIFVGVSNGIGLIKIIILLVLLKLFIILILFFRNKEEFYKVKNYLIKKKNEFLTNIYKIK